MGCNDKYIFSGDIQSTDSVDIESTNNKVKIYFDEKWKCIVMNI